jgi:CRISPR-associated exonuclease Cas4
MSDPMFIENANLMYASLLIEYWYCPRFVYFMKVLEVREYEEKRLKVKIGRDEHEKKALQPEYLRKKLGVIRQEKDVYLSDPTKKICGILDEVLFFEDGKISLLDYKFAYNKHKFKTQFLQGVFYSLLLEANYNTKVDCCYIVYTREKNRIVKYDIKEGDKKEVLDAIKEARRIISTGYFPKGTGVKKRCPDCTFRNICIR